MLLEGHLRAKQPAQSKFPLGQPTGHVDFLWPPHDPPILPCYLTRQAEAHEELSQLPGSEGGEWPTPGSKEDQSAPAISFWTSSSLSWVNSGRSRYRTPTHAHISWTCSSSRDQRPWARPFCLSGQWTNCQQNGHYRERGHIPAEQKRKIYNSQHPMAHTHARLPP